MSCPHAGGPAVHLEALRQELCGRGSVPGVPEPPGRPRGLLVHTRTRGPQRSATTSWSPGTPSAWSHWWPWATRICPADNPVLAAARITGVLRASDREHQSPDSAHGI